MTVAGVESLIQAPPNPYLYRVACEMTFWYTEYDTAPGSLNRNSKVN